MVSALSFFKENAAAENHFSLQPSFDMMKDKTN